MDRRYLFIAGCERSGTTAAVRLLNTHPKIVMGIERYRLVKRKIAPTLFEKDRFFDFREGDTDVIAHRKDYDALKEKFDEATIFGDKNPRYFLSYKALFKSFPGCRVLFMIRDIEPVASSWNARAAAPKDRWPEKNDYRVAVATWNRANSLTARAATKHPKSLLVVDYAKLFSGDKDYLLRLLEDVQIDPHPTLLQQFEKMTSGWDDRSGRPLNLTQEQKDYLAAKADLKTYKDLIALAAR